jgi:hypothetical protein
MQMNDILNEIKTRGRQNLDAIKTHHDIKAGERGASGRNKTKSSINGLACPRPPMARRNPISIPIFASRPMRGTPLKCNRKDGYTRDPISGQIRKCVSER